MSRKKKQRPTQITISGRLISKQTEKELGDIRNFEGSEAFKKAEDVAGEIEQNKHGDIYIYSQPDALGKMAVRGGHKNYGYSGYFLAYIHDGEEWRRFAFNKLIDYAKRHYGKQEDKGKVTQNIREIVSSWVNSIASLDPKTKFFRILDKEIQSFNPHK